MPEYLDDPSVLTKDKLKSELLAHNVELPSGNPTKDVFVQLYLKELTARNGRRLPASLDAFSSDEELPPPPPPPVLPSRNRSSGRKSTSRAERALLGELDVSELTDQGLREELLGHGLDAGPIVASTRKLYEKKLRELLDSDHAPSEVILAETKVTSNGSADPELYSDQDDDVAEAPPEPAAAPEPLPGAERPLRSRGKGPLAQRPTVEKIAASEQTVAPEEDDVQKEPPPSDLGGPTGISATCRRPIKGAADRPVRPGELWKESRLFSPNAPRLPESRLAHRRPSAPPPAALNSSASPRPVFAAPLAGQTPAARRGAVPWTKLLLLALLAALFFFVYQTMEPNSISPFDVAGVGGARGGKA